MELDVTTGAFDLLRQDAVPEIEQTEADALKYRYE